MTLADHVRILGRGPGRSRSLTEAEAAEAMTLMLKGDAAPEAVGALLMLLRMKGETPEEIAGFARAAKGGCPPLPQVSLDWPSYAAGRTRGLPWFLLSARLVALAGHRVLLHGWNGADGAVRAHLAEAGIRTAGPDELGAVLDKDGIAYAPLERLNPGIFNLLQLREKLGLRSCVNTVCRMLNPAGTGAVVQGVFHPSYRALQASAAQRLGWQSLSVLKGAGGEVERHPGKDVTAHGLRNGRPWSGTFAAASDLRLRLAEVTGTSDLAALWSGRAACPVARQIVIGTAAIALDTLGHEDAEGLAEALWHARPLPLAA